MKIHDHRQMSDFRSVLEMMPDEHCFLEHKVHLFRMLGLDLIQVQVDVPLLSLGVNGNER